MQITCSLKKFRFIGKLRGQTIEGHEPILTDEWK